VQQGCPAQKLAKGGSRCPIDLEGYYFVPTISQWCENKRKRIDEADVLRMMPMLLAFFAMFSCRDHHFWHHPCVENLDSTTWKIVVGLGRCRTV